MSAAIDLIGDDLKIVGSSKSSTSFYRDVALGYIFHGLSFSASQNNSLRNFSEMPLNTFLGIGESTATKMVEEQGLK